MAIKNDKIIKIGKSIRYQSEIERRNRGQKIAVARFDVEGKMPNGSFLTHLWLANQLEYQPQHNIQRDIAGNFRGTTGSYIHSECESGSQYVSKNSPLGVKLLTSNFGTIVYRAPISAYSREFTDREITFTSKATYTPGNPVKNLQIQGIGLQTYRFASIKDLLSQIDRLEAEIARKIKEQEERARETARLKAEEDARRAEMMRLEAEEAEKKRIEAERLAQEQRIREEEAQKESEEIARLEQEHLSAIERIQQTNSAFRSGREMRVQHITDPSQTAAKTSHIFDGIPIVIDGGPGTGKTTTLIQRLKFLIDPYLYEHEACKLNERQIEILTDPATVNDHWLFISPSDLLAQYLKSALSAEGLKNDSKNVLTFGRFLSNQLREYFPRPTEGSAPFTALRDDDARFRETIIIDSRKAVEGFNSFVVSNIQKQFFNANTISIDGFIWEPCAKYIQDICAKVSQISSLAELARLFSRLYQDARPEALKHVEQLNKSIEILANRLRIAILADEETKEIIEILFEEWAEKKSIQDIEDDDTTDEEPIISLNTTSFDAKLYQNLKSTIKRLALRSIDTSISLSKRQKEFYEEVKQYVKEEDLTEIAKLAWFQYNFAKLCNGFEQGVLNKIPRLYKQYRREQSKSKDSAYNKTLLSDIIGTREGRMLHPDEEALILGFINNTLLSVRRWSGMQFKELKHAFAKAYNKAVKYVIGIDEASDYSVLDYYCLFSFAHYDFSAITLCGDIMQGLGANGLNSWNELEQWVTRHIEVITLQQSYRQWPTLLEVSRKMYRDDQGVEAPYTSALAKMQYEASPIAFVSKSEDEKVDWIATQIDTVCRRFEGLPSIAIFVNDDEDVEAFVERLRNNDAMIDGNYPIENRTAGYQGREDEIRVFRLSEVKGMEFEIAFFHNIDNSKIANQSLLRRYLYVGISRAVSHLGATFNNHDSEVLKYFDSIHNSWKI